MPNFRKSLDGDAIIDFVVLESHIPLEERLGGCKHGIQRYCMVHMKGIQCIEMLGVGFLFGQFVF